MRPHKKRLVFAGIIIVCALLSVWLVYRLLHPSSPIVVDNASLTTFDIYSYEELALSPEGDKVYYGLRSYYLLKDNSWHRNNAGDDWINDVSPFTSISPTGRFITASDNSKSYLLDLEQNTYRDDAFICKSWSKDGSRCIDINGNLIDVPENKKVENWDHNVDFGKVKKVSGNGMYLWDEERKIPIAFIVPCPIRDEKTGVISKTSCELQSLSKNFDQAADGFVKQFFQVQGNDTVVDWVFSPSGDYILLAVWEQNPHTYRDLRDFSITDYVTDTRLVLVDWRTQKVFDLARLSQFVPDRPISTHFGNMQWSANGNTIIVPIDERGKLLVLKIKQCSAQNFHTHHMQCKQ